MSAVVFVDVESTGLDDTDEIWEFAAIRRHRDSEHETHAFIDHDPAKCARLPEPFQADHLARFPGAGPDGCTGVSLDAHSRASAADLFERAFNDWPQSGGSPTLVAAAPHFDAGLISRHMAEYGLRPGWSHRYRCVETLAAGRLGHDPGGLGDCARALGIDIDPAARHTAMGDVLLCRAIWDVVFGAGSGDGGG